MIKRKIKEYLDYRKKAKRVKKLKKYFLDRKSIEIMNHKLVYQYNRDHEKLIDSLIEMGLDWYYIEELEQFKGKQLVLCGEGKLYNYGIKLLLHSEWKNNFREIKNNYDMLKKIKDNEVAVVLCRDREENKKMRKKYVQSNIYFPKHTVLVGNIGKQYFDMFEPRKDEVFVDAGAFDGMTDVDFAKWAKNNYKKIYAFEPDKDNYYICRKTWGANNIYGITAINKGAWNKEDTLKFSNNNSGGKITEGGEETIEVTTIDNTILEEDMVTYIKMDIEGVELKALEGARKTIERCIPRMAICIYHRDEDLYTIPEYILSINSNYRFYVRHYSSYSWETVLYAVPLEL